MNQDEYADQVRADYKNIFRSYALDESGVIEKRMAKAKKYNTARSPDISEATDRPHITISVERFVKNMKMELDGILGRDNFVIGSAAGERGSTCTTKPAIFEARWMIRAYLPRSRLQTMMCSCPSTLTVIVRPL